MSVDDKESPGPQSWKDHDGNIGYLIKSTNFFIVYLDKEGDVDWETTDEHEKTLDANAVGLVSNRVALVNALPLVYLSKEARLSLGRMLGEATARALEHDSEAAHRMLDDAQAFALARIRERARGWYLVGAAIAAVAVGALVFPVLTLVESVVPISEATKQRLFAGAVAGTFGALISMLLRSGSAPFNASASKAVHYIDGVSRVLVGAFGGLLVPLAVSARVIAPDITNRAVIALLGVAAGFSERWVPSLIERVEVSLLDADGRLHTDGDGKAIEGKLKPSGNLPSRRP
jgi:hypothetical protein